MTEPTAGPYSAEAGVKIRQARTDAGLSLTEAAAKSGRFSAPALRSWEAGQRGLTIDRAVEVAHFYGISPASLMPTEPAADIDETTAAAFYLILSNAGATRKLARMLAAAGCVPPGATPHVLEPGEPLIHTDGEVNMLGTVIDQLRAQIRDRDSITVDDPPDGTP
jgi:transcriptional regulator with XRE-family HTH domain